MPKISADNNKRFSNTTPRSISNILKLGSRLSFVIVHCNPVQHKISGDYVVEFTLLFKYHRFLQFRLEMLQASFKRNTQKHTAFVPQPIIWSQSRTGVRQLEVRNSLDIRRLSRPAFQHQFAQVGVLPPIYSQL